MGLDRVDTVNIVDGAVSAAKLSAALQDLVPNMVLTGTDSQNGTGFMAIQVRDANNNNLSARFLIRTWIADAEYSEPDVQTGFGGPGSSEQMREIEVNADYEILTNASGYGVMIIDAGGAKTVYVMAELDGRIYTGTVEITAP